MTGTSPTAARLWELLPAAYRVRDAETGGVLADLVAVLAGQVDVLAEEVGQLADDRFIETAAQWAVPYLGELVGYRVIHGDVPGVGSSRAEVANTVGYRRRKGTAAVVEQVARDVTRWPARVVESFETLVTTQYMNHVRPTATATPDLRDHAALFWIGAQGGAFDDLDRTADVRAVDAVAPSRPGRYGIRELALFLWRTAAVPWERTPLVGAGDGRRFRLDPLGADTPLFSLPRAETDIVHLAEPRDVPQPLGRRWVAAHATAVYGRPVAGARRSILLESQTGDDEPVAVAAARVRFCDLSDVPGGGGAWSHEPAADAVAVDPVLGRVFLGTALAAGERLLGSVAFGVSVPAGVGDPRPVAVAAPAPVVEGRGGEDPQPLLDGVQHGGTVRLADTDRYEHALTLTARTGPADQPEVEVRLEAAPRARPTLVLDALRLLPEPRTTVVLQGLLVAGGPVVLDEVGDTERRTVVIRDCTLVPGAERTSTGEAAHPERASLIVLDPAAVVRIERSVLGPIVAVEGADVQIVDSIVDASSRTSVAICGRAAGGLRTVTTTADMATGDGTEPAGTVSLDATTVVGGIRCTTLDASNSLLVAALAAGDPRPAAVFAERRQTGCLRYTFVPEGSRTGRRFHCAPDPDDTLHEQRATRPRFDAMRFGDPGYLRLRTGAHPRIRRGADDESEMGVTHRDHAPQREANLVIRLDEYLRLGLTAGRFTAT